jgi:hypothetical protein
MEIDLLNKTNNRYLAVSFMVLLVLFLYFGGTAMMQGGMSGRIKENGWIGGNGWGWIPALFTFVLVVFIGWLLIRKKV